MGVLYLFYLALPVFDIVVQESGTFAVNFLNYRFCYIRPDEGVSATKHL
jgi:hypothetical protein